MNIIMPLRLWLQDYCTVAFFSISSQAGRWEIYLVNQAHPLCGWVSSLLWVKASSPSLCPP